MRLALIVDQFPQLSETFILHHITGLLARGCFVTVFARKTEPELYVHPSYFTYQLQDRTVYLPHQERSISQLLCLPLSIPQAICQQGPLRTLNLFRYGFAALRLRAFYGISALMRQQFDVVHCHYGHIGRAFIPVRDILNVPFVTSFHSSHFSRFGWAALYRPLFRIGDAFVANSDFTRRSLLELGCPPDKVRQIPALSGIDKDGIRANPKRYLRTILTVARLHEAKGIQYCLDALHSLIQAGHRLNYVIVGEGPYRAALEAKVHTLGLANHVRFTGWLPTPGVRREYEGADLFVLASIRDGRDGWVETQGVVIQEAQLFGLPVIGSNIGGIPESLDHGRAGILFEPGNFNALATAIDELVKNPYRAHAIADAGTSYCREHYNSDLILGRLIHLYEDLIAAKTSHSR